MVPTSNLIAFVIAAFVIVVLPGPSVLFVIGRALSIGRVGALLSVLGNAIGMFVQVVVISAGLGALLESSIVLLTVIKFVGAGFLVYLGIQAIRHRKRVTTTGADAAPTSKIRSLVEGSIVGITNPKSIVFFVAVLPQFVEVSAGSVQLQLLELGAIFAVMAVAFDSIWALAAGFARGWFGASPRRLSGLGAAGGVALIGLGVGVAVTGTKS